MTDKMKKNVCGICEALNSPPPCRGHAKTGGGGGSGESERSDNPSQSDNDNLGQKVLSVVNAENSFSSWEKWALYLKFNLGKTDLETEFLNIQCDNLQGVLIFPIKPGLSKENFELAKVVQQKIKAEFDLFKEEFQEKGISVSQFNVVICDKNLTIILPNPKYFAEFIQRLAEKNLLPPPKNEKSFEEAIEKKSTPVDFLKKPKPNFI